jgi:hypothetical protein
VGNHQCLGIDKLAEMVYTATMILEHTFAMKGDTRL